MEYINKIPYIERERHIDIAYLQDCFSKDDGSFYPDIDSDQSYSNFSSKKYRKGVYGWENLLLLEQNKRCCYCMRNLDNCARNIEHVIPRNIVGDNYKEEFLKYTKASDFLRDNVMLSLDFSKIRFGSSKEIAEEKRMPHRIALQNLLVSCNGKFGNPKSGCCCNNARSNDFLQPLMLMPNGNKNIFYDGISGVVAIYPNEPSWAKMLEMLNDDTYKEIRVLWYKIWNFNQRLNLKTVKDFQLKDRIMFFKEIFNQNNFEEVPNEYHKYTGLPDGNSTYWNLLMDFDWFYTYNWR